MSLQKAVANALTFAHLNGFGRKKNAARAEDEDDKGEDKKGPDAESEDDDEGEGEEWPDDKEKPGAEDDSQDADAKAEDEGDEGDDKSKSSAKAADRFAAGRAAERTRGAAIFGSPAAARNVALAAELAFGTDMAADRVVAILEKTSPAASIDRSSRNPQALARSNAQPAPGAAVAAGWDAAMRKASGKR